MLAVLHGNFNQKLLIQAQLDLVELFRIFTGCSHQHGVNNWHFTFEKCGKRIEERLQKVVSREPFRTLLQFGQFVLCFVYQKVKLVYERTFDKSIEERAAIIVKV